MKCAGTKKSLSLLTGSSSSSADHNLRPQLRLLKPTLATASRKSTWLLGGLMHLCLLRDGIWEVDGKFFYQKSPPKFHPSSKAHCPLPASMPQKSLLLTLGRSRETKKSEIPKLHLPQWSLIQRLWNDDYLKSGKVPHQTSSALGRGFGEWGGPRGQGNVSHSCQTG